MSRQTILRVVVIALVILNYRTIHAQFPVTRIQDIETCPKAPRSPFRYAIIWDHVGEYGNYPAGPTRKSRGVDVLLDPKSFSEENLKQLFALLSKRFPEPTELLVSVYTDLEDIMTPEEGDFIWENCTLDLAKLTPKYPWAFYMRTSDSEHFTYHTKQPNEQPKQVVLRGRL